MQGSITRAFDAKVDDVDVTERSVVARINTNEIDRYHTVIDPKGGRFDNYNRNKIVLWEHGKDPRRGTDPIGRNIWIKNHGSEIRAKTQFLKDDFSQQRYEWYRDGVLSGFSVNILPDMAQAGPPTKDEVRARPELEALTRVFNETEGRQGVIFRTWDLAEYSGTAVPGNANALTLERSSQLLECVEHGLWLPDEVLQVCRTMTDSLGGGPAGGFTVEPERVESEPENAKRYITHSGDKWIVHAEDGKVLGEHGDEDSAKEQLAAIEAHKHAGDRRSIMEYGGYWRIVEPDGSIVMPSFPDATTAEQCLRCLEEPPKDFAALAMEVLAPMAARAEQFGRDVEEYINLKRNWRV